MEKYWFIKSWLYLLLYIFSFVCVGTLIQDGHYIQGALFLCGIILVLFIIYEKGVTDELLWINTALMEDNGLEKIKKQSQFYSSMSIYLRHGQIKKDMSSKEIYNFLEKEYQSEVSFRPYLYFSPEKKNNTIKLHGFGLGIPAPKLILEIKDGRLVNWKEKK